MAKAEELLRVKLGSKAGKAAARITAEGVVVASIDGTVGALLEVNCETTSSPRTTASWRWPMLRCPWSRSKTPRTGLWVRLRLSGWLGPTWKRCAKV